MSARIEFPQPEVLSPDIGRQCFTAIANGEVLPFIWCGNAFDARRLRTGNVYRTRADAEARRDWNAQQVARLVTPAWFRELGPEVEVYQYGRWARYTSVAANLGAEVDWSRAIPENFRAKPRDVVVSVNSKEYRWPETVKRNVERGDRFIVRDDGYGFFVSEKTGSYCGHLTHYTRAGAEQQLAAMKAAAGVP
jgi:hypothetical protein